MGMLALLLIQMFPQTVAVAAIYLMMLKSARSSPDRARTSRLAVIVVYLGGAMGVQTWLMKGFFDTIPTELDESARVDGATAAQIFWGVDPAARGAGARRRRADLVRLHAERVRDRLGPPADERATTRCRSGMQQLHQPAVRQALGPVRGGRR